jgi:hypothetical protein
MRELQRVQKIDRAKEAFNRMENNKSSHNKSTTDRGNTGVGIFET